MPLACFGANNVSTHWKHTIRRTAPLMAQHCQLTPIRNEPGKGYYVSTFILNERAVTHTLFLLFFFHKLLFIAIFAKVNICSLILRHYEKETITRSCRIAQLCKPC